MQRCLKDQIGRNVHAYVDDIAFMTRKGSYLISDLQDTFENLRRYKMLLNPLNCVFGVPAGKLLGFIVSHRGIEVNPEKIKAILNIKRPTCLKNVQQLSGCVAAIRRFVSRLGEKELPLYKLLKRTDKFVWDNVPDATLQELKNILSSPPILAAPEESEPMFLYLAASNKVISIVIVVDRKEEGYEYGVQQPVYYISEHPMTVVSIAPLSTIINNSDVTGRVAKWGIELSAFDINYKARNAIKSQILVDFFVDWTEAREGTPVSELEARVMHFNGSKQHQGSRDGVTLKSPTGEELQYVLQIHFEATNNMAEYEALLHGLRIAKEIGIKHIICCGDSNLVAHQVAGTWNARKSVMAAYRDEVDEIDKCFLGYEVKYCYPPTSFTIPVSFAYNEENADEARQPSMDLLEEARNLADQRSIIYQQKLRCYHSRRVQNRSFKEGDLVLRLRQVKVHKLQSPWKVPFVVSKVLHNGSYYLYDIRELKDVHANFLQKRKREDLGDVYDETYCPWNIAQLHPFHT
ncbi:hypothetical protein QYE76_023180 [Lolium multiflorum]|uniref:RNase H type-1 domain-containing protein n=1 Tax=Lolium multiflorum TaxID=4521 RepID=A0AAD8R9Q7_LOLMU|nr:hypothetical protein QYE76_023180 [Lolium multiflorum]